MPPINFLIKPASSNCNLKCKYCFYHSIASSREVSSYGIMKEETLESIVRKGLEYADGICGFAFQGGEPTIAGLEFFKKFIKLQEKYNVKKVKIINSLQTNGMFIDEQWTQFLHDNNFLVGLSLDGHKEVHNANRLDSQNDGTFKKVMKTVELFNKFKVEYNILYVVTSNSARYASKIYKFFKENNFKYLQFIPCLDPINEEPGKYKFSLKPNDFEKFLKITFDLWYEDFMRDNYVSIRYFDNLISMMLGQRPEACNMTGRCQCNIVIEGDGGVYPCDFYVLDNWYLGNIRETEIEDMLNSEVANKFVEYSFNIPDQCKECRWYSLCRGGCRRESENFQEGKRTLNYYCSAYKSFFDYAYSRMLKIRSLVARR